MLALMVVVCPRTRGHALEVSGQEVAFPQDLRFSASGAIARSCSASEDIRRAGVCVHLPCLPRCSARSPECEHGRCPVRSHLRGRTGSAPASGLVASVDEAERAGPGGLPPARCGPRASCRALCSLPSPAARNADFLGDDREGQTEWAGARQPVPGQVIDAALMGGGHLLPHLAAASWAAAADEARSSIKASTASWAAVSSTSPAVISAF